MLTACTLNLSRRRPRMNGDIGDVIAQAAKSKLGIFALMIILISGLARAFFWKASQRVRIYVFAALFLGVVLFGVSVSQTSSSSSPNPAPIQNSSAESTVPSEPSCSGVVRDLQTQQPINGAKVTLTSNAVNQVTYTDGEGYFHFPAQPVGDVVLSITGTGYAPYSRTVGLPDKQYEDIRLVKK
jgi:hypothetical protein